jgi:hypothetical protein
LDHSDAEHEFRLRSAVCQHSFADTAQLSTFVEVAAITPQSNVLDVGCNVNLQPAKDQTLG